MDITLVNPRPSFVNRVRLHQFVAGTGEAEMVNCNNAAAAVAHRGGRVEGAFLIEISDGKITNFHAIRNPDKLLAVAVPRRISR